MKCKIITSVLSSCLENEINEFLEEIEANHYVKTIQLSQWLGVYTCAIFYERKDGWKEE